MAFFYTLADGSPFLRLAKWEDGRSVPLEVYLMDAPIPGSKAFGSCSCPSPKYPCKHQPIKEALWLAAAGNKAQLHLWAWDEILGLLALNDTKLLD